MHMNTNIHVKNRWIYLADDGEITKLARVLRRSLKGLKEKNFGVDLSIFIDF